MIDISFVSFLYQELENVEKWTSFYLKLAHMCAGNIE